MLTKTVTLPQPARASGLLIAALLVGSLAACNGGGPASSPSPNPTPGASPISSPTPDDASPPPIPTASPTQGQGDIEHPTGSTDVILRMEQGGGFVPLGFMVTQAPDFTLYGDGTFILKPLEDPELPPGWDVAQPRFLQGQLDEEAVQALLLFALDQGRLAAARENYTQDNIADASTTIFTVNAGGISKTVSVYALSELPEPQRDAVDRAAFFELAELLRSFEGRARDGELGEVVIYEPTHYRVSLLETFGEPTTEVQPWPWSDITPDEGFAPTDEFGLPLAILSAEQVAQLTDVPSGGHPGIWVEYEGTLWQLGVRPLLPDEAPQG